jgi:uncharacterized repeat protein (TIGR01451 family)
MARLLGLTVALAAVSSVSLVGATPVTVTITKISGTTLEAAGRKDADWYVGVTLDGVLTDTHGLRATDRATTEPFWQFKADVPAGPGTVAVGIQVWEADGCNDAFCTTCNAGGGNICGRCAWNDCSEDDHADVNPDPDLMDVELSVNLANGTWSGTTSGNCASGDNPDATALVCWDAAVDSTTGDDDGDSILDNWERYGADLDGDGRVDLDLPKMGANPLHKDLFLELDWTFGREPSAAVVRAVKEAFAEAPIDAGGVKNPDGRKGITLHVDTGSLSDANGLVGDDLGGGNEILGGPDLCGGVWGDAFRNAKSANFDNARRAQVFRYGISAACSTEKLGGQAEMGGNDLVDYSQHAGVLMHEFGHTLNLGHGGPGAPNPDPRACKPNYLSVMNYHYLAGMNAIGGLVGIELPQSPVFNLDFSPARIPSGRARAPLPTLDEQRLTEEIILDPTDPLHMFIYMDGRGRMRLNPVNQTVDWNGDMDRVDSNLNLNIDNSVMVETCQPQDTGTALPVPSPLDGHDDWRNIVFSLRMYGDPAHVEVKPAEEPDIDEKQLRRLLAQIHSTDLAIGKTADPGAVARGGRLFYALTVKNLGPGPSLGSRVVDTLPAGVILRGVPPTCSVGPPDTVTCEVGTLRVGETATLDLATTVTPAARDPLVNQATVATLFGADPAPRNNTATTSTRVRGGVPP